MRHRSKLHEKKINSGLKSRDSGLCGANVGTTKRKRPKIPYFRTAACRSKFKGHVIQPQKKRRRSPDQTASIAKGMAELHLPFLSSAESCSLSTSEVLQKLGWSTINEVPFPNDAWGDARPSPDRESTLCPKGNRPDWRAPPVARPDRAIRAYLDHLHCVWYREPRLQIPADWPIFSSLDWDEEHLFTVGSTDSSDILSRNRNPASIHCEKSSMKGQEIPHKTAIHCHLRSIQQPRVRIQWQLMQSMRPSWFKWRYQTEVRAKRRHARRHAGFIDYNQPSPNHDVWPQTCISAFLLTRRREPIPYSTCVDWLGEAHILNEIGRLISNMVATDAFPPQSQQTLKWPPCLSLGSQSPIIDYTCRARDVSFGRHQSFHPLLFAAQRHGRPKEAFQQLALAFQPMMTLFILCYLDTRKNCEEPMPHWMVLFGVAYDHDGFCLQAFLPSFRPRDYNALHGTSDWGWGATSAGLSYDHVIVMTKYPWYRSSCMELLYRIQGHCVHVLERLRAWDGYERACKLLSITDD